MAKSNIIKISGQDNGERIESRILEERIQQAVKDGATTIEVQACGQHGIGGRLWINKDVPVSVKVTGSPGQRLGSMGFPGTSIEVDGPGSDDIGWLNTGAEIVVRGNASNGICNAMAQGKVYIGGHIGSRGMTMTKQNPRLTPPELWVQDDVGDYFAEFMAGGIAVVCGLNPVKPDNVLGYRPCVGMVGGKIFFRGPHKGYSTADAKIIEISDEDWAWLTENLEIFLNKVGKPEELKKFSNREEWQLITARSPLERVSKKRRTMAEFHSDVWDAELGRGGLIGDLTSLDRSPIPLITTGEMRRNVPVWENRKYAAPCQNSCPSGIPVRERWGLIRAGELNKAVDLAMRYTPFPATVCGHLCPNLCMEGCTRTTQKMAPVDAKGLGQAGIDASDPELPALSGHKVAVIGGGPAGISVAWQLRLLGHEATIFDREKELGGKITSQIPEGRIPTDVLKAELERVRRILPHVQVEKDLTKADFEKLKNDFEFVVLATGSQKPRIIPMPGKERLVTAGDFLRSAKDGSATPGKRIVIIGAGNVGCDVASEAGRLGAEEITLLDVQEPASFGKEREEAEKYGATFRWPCFSKEVTAEGLLLNTGELIPADTVVISIGDMPDLDFLPETIDTDRGYVTVNEAFQTTDPQVFAIGDVIRLGLLTQAIGDGRRAAVVMDGIFSGARPVGDPAEMTADLRARLDYVDDEGRLSEMIDYSRMSLEYFDPRKDSFDSVQECATECSSCGACRDCGLCVTVCPQGAISRQEKDDDFEMVSNPDKCIGCGFCADACPCGIWSLIKNTPIG
ncbi:FAD-dependent oxidoreductase [Desulfovibrio ferrophilus]|uniref:FAD-dependent pyridine nucleotide-disulfideoxidoreductase n=1 Tax=Desulfovibrio ferrophilus TaxID=241368 RepID=A0A2Z6AWY4_9BACT|nr:FAD-dependent oxidoreductase [Desulfovibrio ferrophilus]BBD07767.1 FAD-dependent pyridine nucleotide-disulfideoxidoreductase [Desulfovibrio ferrophilus]